MLSFAAYQRRLASIDVEMEEELEQMRERLAVCCLLSAVCCLLSAVCCLLSAVCCLLSAVCCLLSAVCGLLSAVCCGDGGGAGTNERTVRVTVVLQWCYGGVMLPLRRTFYALSISPFIKEGAYQ
jgi:hypothetical protein